MTRVERVRAWCWFRLAIGAARINGWATARWYGAAVVEPGQRERMRADAVDAFMHEVLGE
jgi:hypothetical protein